MIGNSEYYNKFLTSKNQNKKLSTINSGDNTNSLSIQTEIPEITYNLYMQQAGESLSKEFYKTKLQEQSNPKKKYLKNKKTSFNLKNNNSGKLKQNPKMKKELYEEIIRANSKSLRNNNPYLVENEVNEEEIENEEEQDVEEEEVIKKFNDDDLMLKNVAKINLENEVENNRIELEKIHKQLIDNELPIIFEGINDLIGNKSNTEFYFIKNKYDDILKDYL